MTRRKPAPTGLLVFLCSATVTAMAEPSILNAQDAEVRSVLEANLRPLTIDANGLHGTGGDWLIDRARAARFTLIGESHLTAETPVFVSRLLEALRPAGYSTYVLETGPESTRLLAEAVADGGVAAGEAFFAEFPSSLVFVDHREELQAVAEALGLGYDVWGVDQEFIGSPHLLLSRLRELSTDAAAQMAVQSMLERETAASAQSVRSGDWSNGFMLTAGSEEFDALEAAFPNQLSEAGRIVQQLRASARTYQLWYQDRYEGNAERIDLIKRNFLAHVVRAGETPLSGRRALIKMGDVHVGRGRSPTYQHDLGNFTAELAVAGNGESFHILVRATGSIAPDGTINPSLDALPYLGPTIEFAAEDHPVVFDLEPLRSILTRRDDKPRDLQQLQDVALRYDALVLFPRYHRATCSVTTWLC